MATSSRESRRRKIVERGADRLAFIQGRISTLPANSQDDSTSGPSQPPVSLAQDPPPTVSHQATVSACAEEEAAFPDLPKQDSLADVGLTNAHEGGVGGEVESHVGETGVEGSTVSALNFSREVEQLPASIPDQSPAISTSETIESSELQRRQYNRFTPKLIISAISLSERIRLFCSITVAILVVFSHLRLPLLGSWIIKSIISFGALYLVLLTNLTIVIAQLLFHDHGAIERPVNGETKSAATDEYGWAKQLSMTLELGHVMQKVLDAAFMDCGVYAIIIVCGLSFA
ncbi:hypothetical protein SLE2022_187080 [Rubroshorea leprosula]